ncbi:MAG TPA: OPT/YSL family transporter, partial [Myxococcaceae bacterium]|nr:OPT/YSL family transporter [Myxococcaceae bacterium]
MAPINPKSASLPPQPEGAPQETLAHSVPAPENPELTWLRTVYRPDERQLTVRAVLAGMVIGVAMCASNLYVVLKTGWSLGVTITACILAYGVFRLLHALRLSRSAFTELENNAMGSVASAAGYMTGGGNMAALPALIMLTGIRPDGWGLVLWFATISALGVFAAIPIKRQLVNIEQLPFPTGTATAQTIQALHSHSDEGAKKGKLLGLAALAGGVLAWIRDARGAWMPVNLPERFGLPFSFGGTPASTYTLAFDNSLLLAGTGALMSFRVGWSLLVGALLMWGVVGPKLVAEGIISGPGYKPVLTWAIWPGAAMLVSSGLLSFAFQWKSVARSFSGLAGTFTGRKAARSEDPLAEVECPPSWFPLGFALLGPVVVVLAWWLFDIPMWAGLMALPLAFAMGMVAARVTGETDTTPTKALGPLTQLVYGGLLPGQLVPNIMSANVTGGVGLHSADLLTDLKSGYLLGARPR